MLCHGGVLLFIVVLIFKTLFLLLISGGTYKFRIAAIYDNNDNKIGKNSERFTLHVAPASHPEPPVGHPTIVEAIPMVYENVHAIRIHWQVCREGRQLTYIPDYQLQCYQSLNLKFPTS